MAILLKKSLVRSAIATVAQSLGQLRLAESRQRNTLTILCYHRVLPHDARLQYFDPSLVVTPDMFEAHCRVLAKHYDVVTLEQGLEAWTSGAPSQRPLAAITFDDGYRDNEIYAAPILAKYGLKATFYIVAGMVGTNEQPWYDRAGRALLQLGREAAVEVGMAKQLTPEARRAWLEELEAEAGRPAVPDHDLIMDADALRRLVGEGHAIGSHTVSHPLLDQLAAQNLEDEVLRSKEVLASATGYDVTGFSYPNGNYNDAVKSAVTRGDYAYAVSAAPGINELNTLDILALKRWFISQDRLSTAAGVPSPALLRMEISGLSQRLFKREVVS